MLSPGAEQDHRLGQGSALGGGHQAGVGVGAAARLAEPKPAWTQGVGLVAELHRCPMPVRCPKPVRCEPPRQHDRCQQPPRRTRLHCPLQYNLCCTCVLGCGFPPGSRKAADGDERWEERERENDDNYREQTLRAQRDNREGTASTGGGSSSTGGDVKVTVSKVFGLHSNGSGTNPAIRSVTDCNQGPL